MRTPVSRVGWFAGFTLSELWRVIAIIAIRAAILRPALGKAKTRAPRISGLNNTKPMGITGYTYRLNSGDAQMNFFRQRASLSDIWISYDADDAAAGDPTRQNNDSPDAGDDHGQDAENVVFCDGHAEWVPLKKRLRSWHLGTDEAHNSIIPEPAAFFPGLKSPNPRARPLPSALAPPPSSRPIPPHEPILRSHRF